MLRRKHAHARGAAATRKVAQACKDFGQRVQYSVFECAVGETDLERLRQRLLRVIYLEEDSLRIYRLGGQREEVGWRPMAATVTWISPVPWWYSGCRTVARTGSAESSGTGSARRSVPAIPRAGRNSAGRPGWEGRIYAQTDRRSRPPGRLRIETSSRSGLPAIHQSQPSSGAARGLKPVRIHDTR